MQPRLWLFAVGSAAAYQVGSPLVLGPVLRRNPRASGPALYTDDDEAGDQRSASAFAATAKLQYLLRQQDAAAECAVPNEGYQCCEKNVVVFLRHGESSWNAMNRFTGWHDVPLSAAGEQQAVAAASMLRAAGLESCLDAVYVSSLKRTIKTAWLVLEALDDYTVPVQPAWQLNERMYGLLTGLDKAETQEMLGDELFEELRREPPPLDAGSCYDPTRTRSIRRTTPPELVPRKESFEDVAARVLPYFREAIEPRARTHGEAVLVVSSKNLLRSLIYGVTQWPLDTMVHVDIPNGLPIVYRPDQGTLHVLQPDGSSRYWGRVGGEGPLDMTDAVAARSRQPMA